MNESEVVKQQRDESFFGTGVPPNSTGGAEPLPTMSKQLAAQSDHRTSQTESHVQSLIYSSESGLPLIQVSLTHEPLDLSRASKFIASPSSGANVFFTGTTRNTFQSQTVTRLEYTSYPALALRTMLKLCKTVREKYHLEKVYLIHRLGVVSVGEESIIVGVSSPHRKAAWDGGQELLELVKEKVEVWKREWFIDGRIMEGKDGHVGRDVSLDEKTGKDFGIKPTSNGGDNVGIELSSRRENGDEHGELGSQSHSQPYQILSERSEWRANADTDGRGKTIPTGKDERELQNKVAS